MLVLSCETDLNEVARVTAHEQLPVQTIEGAFITYTDSGKVTFTVEAGKIDRFSGEGQVRDEFSEGVHVQTFDKAGELESEIIADRATKLEKEKLMIAKDSVVLRNKEGKMLNTELLTWDENTHKIHTDRFVKITTATEILYGDGLEAEQDFSKYEIMNIKGRIKIDESDSTESNTQMHE